MWEGNGVYVVPTLGLAGPFEGLQAYSLREKVDSEQVVKQGLEGS